MIVLNPRFFTASGHSRVYIESLKKASVENGWDFLSAVPRKNILSDLEDFYHKVLKSPLSQPDSEQLGLSYRRPRRWVRGKRKIEYYLSLFFFLRKAVSPRFHHIVLLEAFTSEDLSLTVRALPKTSSGRLSFWLIYRHYTAGDAPFLEHLHQKVSDKGIALRLLTDSESVRKAMEISSGMSPEVLPIPHVEYGSVSSEREKKEIVCWWPGSCREGKGLSLIREMTFVRDPYQKYIHLVANERAKLSSSYMCITSLPDPLSAKDYADWMLRSDCILLPYTSAKYRMSTSGIFVEAVSAGKIPVVRDNTWMADELRKHDLSELIIDWSGPAQAIYAIYKCSVIREKLKEMQKQYRSFHSLRTFSSALSSEASKAFIKEER